MRQIVKARKKSVESRLGKRRKIAQSLLAVLFLGSILFGLNYFLRDPIFEINRVIIEGNETLDQVVLIDNVNNSLAGSILILIPRNNKFAYPKNSIKERLIYSFPKLKSVDLDVNGEVLNVSVEEYKEAYVYCFSDSVCQFVSSEGTLFGKATEKDKTEYPLFISPFSAPSQEEVNENVTIANGFANMEVNIKSIERHMNGDVVVSIVDGWQIKYSSNEEPTNILKRFGLALSSDSLSPDKLINLEYIDLHFGNKVFYKYKE
ncbi:MAG TPA: hypothetical protein VJJ22_00875 [Candidatus Paceibacterota bacterium]